MTTSIFKEPLRLEIIDIGADTMERYRSIEDTIGPGEAMFSYSYAQLDVTREILKHLNQRGPISEPTNGDWTGGSLRVMPTHLWTVLMGLQEELKDIETGAADGTAYSEAEGGFASRIDVFGKVKKENLPEVVRILEDPEFFKRFFTKFPHFSIYPDDHPAGNSGFIGLVGGDSE